jgi:2'-5' RNA ligase
LEIYDQLWNAAVSAFERGEPQIDPYLANRSGDLRRGVTLVFRPSKAVLDPIADFIRRFAAICPEQYFYRPEELHVTVLAIVSGTEHWQREMGRVEECRRVIGEALKHRPPFKIRFQGVTASPGVVLVQGFPLDDGLASIRDALRQALARHGLGDMPDRRYKNAGAHLSLMRFAGPCPRLPEVLSFLKANRQTPFGECEITNLEFYLADWYSTTGSVRMLAEYDLKDNRI